MIPILYEKDETQFTSNGLGRLRDCISCEVTEERNGIYECSFEYPVDGAHFSEITPGRIIKVTHDETGEAEPFDIVGASKPIDGLVTFHAVHVSYRQLYLTAYGKNINSLEQAFSMLRNAQPSNPFEYSADFESTAFMAAADGVPRSVRQMLGGVQGSVLDAYGGEFEFTGFSVILHRQRGTHRDFTVRYGVNLLDYTEEVDCSGCYSSCIPYWAGQDDSGNNVTVVAGRTEYGGETYNGRDDCIPLDLTDKFETKPTTAQLQEMAQAVMQLKQPTLPGQNIKVDFIRLQDMPEYEQFAGLMECNLCDTINVVFPRYDMQGEFKIVRTVWDVLAERYVEMELGALQTSLAEALGITQQADNRQESVHILSGQVTVSAVPNNSYKDTTITFAEAFSRVPHVVTGLATATTDTKTVTVSCINVTASGFVLRVFNATGTQRSPAVSWIASDM